MQEALALDGNTYGRADHPKIVYTGTIDDAVNMGKNYIKNKKEVLRDRLDGDERLEVTHPVIQPVFGGSLDDSVLMRSGNEFYAFAYSVVQANKDIYHLTIFEKTNSEGLKDLLESYNLEEKEVVGAQ